MKIINGGEIHPVAVCLGSRGNVLNGVVVMVIHHVRVTGLHICKCVVRACECVSVVHECADVDI